ncbi:hypothetical protein KR054_006794, partial [Drosophila jambulina]
QQRKFVTEMFEFKMSVPQVAAAILRCMFHCARYFGVLCFRLKNTNNGQMTMEENGLWWKWSLAIFRVGCLCWRIFGYMKWIITISDLLRIFIHFIRMPLNAACCLCLLRLHLFQNTKCTQLVNGFLHLFQRVQRLFKGKRAGFGGTHELVILLLTLACPIYEGVFLFRLHLFEEFFVNTFISLSNKLIMHIAIVGYLAIGLLYADLNEFVRTELRSQLDVLEEQPTRRNLRKARRTLDKCLALYVDIQSLTSRFQRIFDLPLVLCFGRNCSSVVAVCLSIYIYHELSLTWLWLKISNEILCMLLLTLSVQRVAVQFGIIHTLTLENSYLSENKEWHTTLDVFYTHLNLHKFRVRPLGLVNISNEMLVVFLSALVTYITFIIQYGMQLEPL